jgi:uncharacterized protein (TIGR00296 family)
MLTIREGALLVKKTRLAIETHLADRGSYDPGPSDGSELWRKTGVFVTITADGSGILRGCIGNPHPQHPLIVEAVQAGILAATSDPRFNPVTLDEFRLRDCLELTVLSPLDPIRSASPPKLKKMIVIGKHGLVVDGYGQQGLLLPQVAVDEGFDEEDFLTNCCLKAGLPPDAWLSDSVKVYRFTGQVFSEEAPSGQIVERQMDQH